MCAQTLIIRLYLNLSDKHLEISWCATVITDCENVMSAKYLSYFPSQKTFEKQF